MLKRFFPILLFCFYASPAVACSCIWSGPFTTVSSNSPIILRGRVKDYGPSLSHGENLYSDMDIEVIRVVKGEYQPKNLKILGDPGHLCRPYISHRAFPINREFLFAIQTPQNNEVALSGCGESSIPIQNGQVMGKKLINGAWEPYSMPYKTFLRSLH